jgi:hypothetical protein
MQVRMEIHVFTKGMDGQDHAWNTIRQVQFLCQSDPTSLKRRFDNFTS